MGAAKGQFIAVMAVPLSMPSSGTVSLIGGPQFPLSSSAM